MAKQTKANVSAPDQLNMVGEGTIFEGSLQAKGDVRISGRIIGTLHAEGKVLLTKEGVVEGELHATDADIAGTVQGEVYVKDRLLLRGTAQIDGDVRTSRLIVEEGAVFGGKCQMGHGDGILADQPVPGEAHAIGGHAAGDVEVTAS